MSLVQAKLKERNNSGGLVEERQSSARLKGSVDQILDFFDKTIDGLMDGFSRDSGLDALGTDEGRETSEMSVLALLDETLDRYDDDMDSPVP